MNCFGFHMGIGNYILFGGGTTKGLDYFSGHGL